MAEKRHINKSTNQQTSMKNPIIRSNLSSLLAIAWIAVLPIAASAAEAPKSEANAANQSADKTETKAEKPPPLPLHQIEGNGVWGITTKWEF